MPLLVKLIGFGIRQVVGETAGAASEIATERVIRHFTDHSETLKNALLRANDRAWQTFGIALAGDSFLDKLKVYIASGDDKGIREQVQLFLRSNSATFRKTPEQFRAACLAEYKKATRAGLFVLSGFTPTEVAKHAAAFERYSDPSGLIKGAESLVDSMARELTPEYPNLATLLQQRPVDGLPLIVTAFTYFFRLEVEANEALARTLVFDGLRSLSQSQETSLRGLGLALSSLGHRIDDILDHLGHIESVVKDAHEDVLKLQKQVDSQSEQFQRVFQAIMGRLEQVHLSGRELRPCDSLSLRNENERQVVKQLVARYRELPEVERRRVPSLLNAVGKLEVIAGDCDAAKRDFQTVAAMATAASIKAEAHFNAYRASLEQQDFEMALTEMFEAVKIDSRRFAPFPVGKYQPQRILGAGGFGVVFQCRHKHMGDAVAVKALLLDDLGRDSDNVFAEATMLRGLEHPAIIRIRECGYADPAGKARPYIVMDYFDGRTLEEHVTKHGPFAFDELLPMARQIAEGLNAAHKAKILHRDIKPANLLVKKSTSGWDVKIIDFGLAMPQKALKSSRHASTAKQRQTAIGFSIAGTVDYSAPEQLGRRSESVGQYSDVYSWAKSCCYALFGTSQPLPTHWSSIPDAFVELLGQCLDENPANRPQNASLVIERIREMTWPTPDAVLQASGAGVRSNAISAAIPRKLAWPLLLGGCALVVAIVAALFFSGSLSQRKVGDDVVASKTDKPSTEKKLRPSPVSSPSMEPTTDKAVPKPGTGPTVKAKDKEELGPGEGRFNILWDSGSIYILEVKGNDLYLLGDIWADGRKFIYSTPLRMTYRVDTKLRTAFAENRAPKTMPLQFQWNYVTGEVTGVDLNNKKPGYGRITPDITAKPAIDPKYDSTDSKTVKLPVQPEERLGVVQRLEGHTDSVQSIAISRDGRYAASGGLDKTVIAWDLSTGKKLHQWVGHTGNIQWVEFYPDGVNVLSGSGDGTVRTWNIKTGKGEKTPIGHAPPGLFYTRCMSDDGTRLLTHGYDRMVRQWELPSGKLLKQFSISKDPKINVWVMAFSPDGKWAMSGGNESVFRLWDVEVGVQKDQFEALNLPDGRFSSDGRTFAAMGQKSSIIQVWDVGSKVVSHQLPMKGSFVFLKNSPVLVVEAYGGLTFVDTLTGRILQTVKGDGTGNVVVSNDGTQALAVGSDHAIRVWRLPKGLKAEMTQEDTKGSVPKPNSSKSSVETFAIGNIAVEMTSTLSDSRQVTFVFRVSKFGTDFSPVTAWLNSNGDVFRRKIGELGAGSGQWEQTKLSWPPQVIGNVAVFEVVFTKR